MMRDIRGSPPPHSLSSTVTLTCMLVLGYIILVSIRIPWYKHIFIQKSCIERAAIKHQSLASRWSTIKRFVFKFDMCSFVYTVVFF